MVSLEVNHRRRQANQVVSCSVYLANEQGVRSDSYSLKAEGDNKSLFSVSVFDRRHWKYLVIVPSFTNHKRMPFEFGFLSVHGDSVECDEGSRAL